MDIGQCAIIAKLGGTVDLSECDCDEVVTILFGLSEVNLLRLSSFNTSTGHTRISIYGSKEFTLIIDNGPLKLERNTVYMLSL